jgi:hypothetical protein
MSWMFDDHSMIMSLFGGLSNDDQKVLNDLKDSAAYESAKVVEYSACVKDADEIMHSDKFKEYQIKAGRLVDND